MTATPCGSCTAPVGDGATLCRGCTGKLAAALKLAADIAPDLDDAVARLLKRGGGGKSSSPEPPLPVDLAASDAAAKLYGILVYWVNQLGGAVLTASARPPVVMSAQTVRAAMEGASVMPEQRCEITDLLTAQCAHCTGADKRAEAGNAARGAWFFARYDGRCSNCDGQFDAGQKIRADGEGGYLCEDCG